MIASGGKDDFPVNRISAEIQHLYGSLFAVPFDAIVTPDIDEETEDQYRFKNPRLNTDAGQSDLMDKAASAELRESIKNNTLLNPLVCRWVEDGDSLVPQLVGGDRRYRAVDFLIRKKEIVTDPRSAKLDEKGIWQYTKCSADQAYAKIACQIFACNSDLDALALSWAENKSRINLSEGHEVAEVIKLRKFDASDERILEILQRDAKWLAETDDLISNLDEATLSDLLESRIDRGSAISLVAIADIEKRTKVREAANASSKETCDKRIQRLQKQIETALDKKEIAEGSFADAEFQKDEVGMEEAKSSVAVADKQVKTMIKERDETVPVTTTKDVKKAAISNGVEEDDRMPRALSAKKLKAGLAYIDSLIENDGECLDGEFTANINTLKLVRSIFNNNILANDDNFAATLKEHCKKHN